MKMHVWITAQDFFSGSMACACEGIDAVLMGDSLGSTVYGLRDMKAVTMAHMLPLAAAVMRGNHTQKRVIFDLPYGTYDTSKKALNHAADVEKLGITSFKIEGYRPEITKAFIAEKYNVTGHLGLLPQTAHTLSQSAKTETEQEVLTRQALNLQALGVSEIVLEHVPSDFATGLQQQLSVPLIGIGAGSGTAGQVLVWSDILGMSERLPPFATAYANMRHIAKNALHDYVKDVHKRSS